MARLLDIHTQQKEILERIVNTHERLRARLLRVTRLLNEARIPYAVIGGNAVAVWVATRDESLVRATRDLDILVRVNDLDRIKSTLEADGFLYRHVAEMDLFVESAEDKVGDAVHLIYAGTYVRPEYPLPAPDVSEAELGEPFCVLPLEDLVKMELVAGKCINRVHVLDLIAAGLIDESWPKHYDEPLRGRLQELIDNPE